jgi:transcriptional regulator with XRE-family HTH domain
MLETNYQTRLRNLRESNGFSREMLAREIEVCTGTIQNWEKGSTDIPATKLIQLADLFNCTAEYLFGLTDDDSDNA